MEGERDDERRQRSGTDTESDRRKREAGGESRDRDMKILGRGSVAISLQ